MGIGNTGDGLLAVGIQLPPSTAVAYRSRDGRAWEPEPGFKPGEETTALAVAADERRRVIVGSRGDDAAAWVSTATAGTSTWDTAPGDAALRAPAGGLAEMRAVVAWRGRFVAVGSRGEEGSRQAAIWISDDGLAWRLVSGGSPVDDARAFGIAAADDALVVVGATGSAGTGSAAAWVSEDAERWTRADSPALEAGPMRAVTAGPAGFVAVGFGASDNRAVAWTSRDGTTWTVAPTTTSLENAGRPIRMAAVAPDGSGFVAGGWKSDAGNGSAVIWRSSDGRTWERTPDQVSMSGASVAGVSSAAGVPVAVGTSGSPDNDQAAAWFLDAYPAGP